MTRAHRPRIEIAPPVPPRRVARRADRVRRRRSGRSRVAPRRRPGGAHVPPRRERGGRVRRRHDDVREPLERGRRARGATRHAIGRLHQRHRAALRGRATRDGRGGHRRRQRRRRAAPLRLRRRPDGRSRARSTLTSTACSIGAPVGRSTNGGLAVATWGPLGCEPASCPREASEYTRIIHEGGRLSRIEIDFRETPARRRPRPGVRVQLRRTRTARFVERTRPRRRRRGDGLVRLRGRAVRHGVPELAVRLLLRRRPGRREPLSVRPAGPRSRPARRSSTAGADEPVRAGSVRAGSVRTRSVRTRSVRSRVRPHRVGPRRVGPRPVGPRPVVRTGSFASGRPEPRQPSAGAGDDRPLPLQWPARSPPRPVR